MDIKDLKLQDLISSSGSRVELWRQVLSIINAKTVVEVGVWKGDFAKEILKQCEHIERYYMIDPWAMLTDWNKPFNVESQIFNEVYAEAMSKTAFASDRIVVLRGRTKEVIADIPDESLDFAYIDGDHTLRGITIDLIKLLPKIKNDGFIAGDDFIANPWQHGINYEPTLVCPFSIYFAEAMDLPFLALPFNQFLIHKNINSSFSFKDFTGNYGDFSLNKIPSMSGFGSRIKSGIKLGLNKIGFHVK